MTDEPLYTLDQARKIVLREQCWRDGQHLIDQDSITTAGGTVSISVYCRRCDTRFAPLGP